MLKKEKKELMSQITISSDILYLSVCDRSVGISKNENESVSPLTNCFAV